MALQFASRLRNARIHAGLSQASLAARFQVSQPTISTWENGTARPAAELKRALTRWIKSVEQEEHVSETSDDLQASAFGEWVSNQRQLEGWSRAELATRAQVSAQTVYLIETGRVRNPGKQTREALVHAFSSEQEPTDLLEELDEEASLEGGNELSEFLPWDDSTISSAKCVYVYYDRTDRPVYIGQTNDLRRRNRQHQENEKWFFRRLVDRGAYIVISTKSERDRIEKLLIHFLGRNTMFNKHHSNSK